MTGEEMERAIDFLLKSQANLEQRIEQVNSNLAARIEAVATCVEEVAGGVEAVGRLLGDLAQTQNDFTLTVTRTFEAQAKFNRRTDERINALISAVERMSESKNGKG